MTREQIEEIALIRLRSVIKDMNKTYEGKWKISADNCCGGGDFEVGVEQFRRPIDDYTKQELVDIIKEALIFITKKRRDYVSVNDKLHNRVYSAENEKELKLISFEASLRSAGKYFEQAEKCFGEMRCSLLEYDEEWTRKYWDARTTYIDPIKFLQGKE